MVVAWFLVLFSVQSVISDEDVRDFNASRLFRLFKDLAQYRPNDVNDHDVTFYLFTRQESNVPIPLQGNTTIDLSKNSKLIIHGWIDNHNRSWYHHLTDAYLTHGDYNVIHVDWGRVSKSFYASSAANTQIVGRYVATFLLNHQFPPKKVHLIGHSLGAHIAGYAADIVEKNLTTKIRRISALDPAGPGFSSVVLGLEKPLVRENAEVVDVYHTDGGFLGLFIPLGSFDVYINGGVRIQPDCRSALGNFTAGLLFEELYCSHTRSYVYFTEIVDSTKFTCAKCGSLFQQMLDSCNLNKKYVFGAEDIDETYTGVCFVDTSK
ncbi:endothelial lipase-like [Zophobas morio]|uniref:endothelial lipase-like n=1 Tax=Zophobas morio TaxID=2755281 RepID=UPI003082CADE